MLMYDMERKNLKLIGDTFERLEEEKPDGVTWDEFFRSRILGDYVPNDPVGGARLCEMREEIGEGFDSVEQLLETMEEQLDTVDKNHGVLNELKEKVENIPVKTVSRLETTIRSRDSDRDGGVL